jgi:hypothetical protein
MRSLPKVLAPVALFACLFALRAQPPKADPPAARTVDYNRDVRPVLADACFACHGPDAKSRKAKLRLDEPNDRASELLAPGKPDASEVLKRLSAPHDNGLMPPPETNKKLTAAQKETLRLWVAQGAKYQKHWAFEAIRRPEPVAPAAHPVDGFLNARIGAAGLKPSAEASREVLARRAAFALTGLPPTAKELDAFLSDTSATAYEKLLDRYFASPRYGEEMAKHWLDVARYADTHGLHLDNERAMWKYRDWVVKAFNDNLPYDKFAVWQLAGDLLPEPTNDQLAATGFNRCNVTTGEGGSIEAEWHYRNAVDRTSTAVQAFLGLTAGCAVCHDHKFDPISTKEYYSLYAFFYSSADPALDSNVSTTGPFVKLPTPDQRAALEAAAKAETEARTAYERAVAKAGGDDPATGKPARLALRELLFDDVFPVGANSNNTSRNAADWVTKPAFGAKSGLRVLRQANSFFHQDNITFRANSILVPANGALEAWVYIDAKQPAQAITLQLGGGKRVWWGAEKAGNFGTRLGDLPKPGAWVQLRATNAELGLTAGAPVASLSLQEHGGVVHWDALALVGDTDPATDPRFSFRAWWKSLNGKAPADVPADLAATVAAGPDGKHEPALVTRLRAHYDAKVKRPSAPELLALRDKWEAARGAHAAAADAIPGTMVFKDLPVPRDSFVMIRGQYDKKGEKVLPGTPAVLPPLKLAEPTKRATRLDLANWMVAKENPLTARVAVNRLWQQFFGTGLVRTSADFGVQGEPPSHPELLDWLAGEYQKDWDTKRLAKLMLTSAAFRRDARASAADRTKDPENRLLARGPRLRLDAEQLRDNALFVSGLMNFEMGGRGVNVYQPPGIWEPVGYADSNTRYYLQDHGAALYRRSIYVFIKRTAPAPFLTNFDGTNREQLCAVRDRTNTPLQALQLMNDVQHFEAARALAERTLAEGGKDTPARIAFLYRTVLGRKPDAGEVRIVSAALAKQRAIFDADAEAAKKVVHTGESKPKGTAPDAEVAAWTLVSNLVLNLDEVVMRN